MKVSHFGFTTLRRLQRVVDTWKGIDDADAASDNVYYGGSLGWQTLQIYRDHGDRWALEGLIAHAFRSDGCVPASLVLALSHCAVLLPKTVGEIHAMQDSCRRWDLLPKKLRPSPATAYHRVLELVDKFSS